MTTVNNSAAFTEGGGGGGAAVGSGRARGGNPRMPDDYGNVELEKDVSSGYGSQLSAHSEDTTVSLIVHTTKNLMLCLCRYH